MSSHHIVREKQEPALLILGMDNFDDEWLGQLLEWSPTVITTALTAEKLNSYGIKIDWIISDEETPVLQSDIKQLPIGGGNLVQSALKYLTDEGYPAVNIVTDDLDLADYLLYINKINLVIFHDRQKIYAVNSGFSKWKLGGELITILTPLAALQCEGLEEVSKNTFKTTTDGFFSLKFNHSFLLIAEEL